MLSHTAEYALRAVVCLAGHRDGPLTSSEVAESTGVPASYLAKVLKMLARAGVVDSRRGRRGGFSLASSPEEVTVLEVINAVDPLQRIDRCPARRGAHDPARPSSPEPARGDVHEAAHGAGLCPLCRELDGAVALVQGVFAECTIARLLAEAAGGPAACLLGSSRPGAFGRQRRHVQSSDHPRPRQGGSHQ